MKTINYYEIFKTEYGWAGVLTSNSGLKRSIFAKSSYSEVSSYLGISDLSARQNSSKTNIFADAIHDILLGIPLTKSILLDFTDFSPFFISAWKACITIPFAQTRSYAWLATQSGNPKALRAAGQAMARNPFAPIVPCHRVISKDVRLHNYSAGGIEIKSNLISAEANYSKL